jgi:hypothetical protein
VSDNFEGFEQQFADNDPDANIHYQDATELGLHIFDLWEHLCIHFAHVAIEARKRGNEDGGMFMLENGVSLSFVFRENNEIYVMAQYPQEVVDEAGRKWLEQNPQ